MSRNRLTEGITVMRLQYSNNGLTSVIDTQKAERNEQRNPGMYTDQQKQCTNEPIYKILVKPKKNISTSCVVAHPPSHCGQF